MITKHVAKTSVVFILAGLAFFSASINARAQTHEAEARDIPSCEFSSHIESLQALTAQKGSASGTETEALLALELETRVSLLSGVLACASYETQQLQKTVNDLS